MYRVAICDDEPHAAEQNEAMLCQILEDRGLKRDIDYSVHCFSSPVPLLALMLVYKCGQEKLNNLYYQMKEQRS